MEFYELIRKKFKNKKSYGSDGIPTFLVKKVLNSIMSLFYYLINLSFCAGQYPSRFKVGRIIPEHKKYKKQDTKNYQLVTISSIFSKIFEYSFLERLLPILGKNNIISNTQYGFCLQKSTTTAMHAIYDKIVTNMAAVDHSVGIFCYLSRAFGCANHDIMTVRLILERLVWHLIG